MDIIFLKNIDKLRECRCDPYAGFVLDACISLSESFLDYHCKVFFLSFVLCLIEIHENRHKRSLSVGRKKCNHLILYGLHALCYLFSEPFLDYGINSFLRDICAHELQLLNEFSSDLFS